VVSTTVLTRREGGRIVVSTTTGFVRWTTHDLTDLDYTPLPLITRDNSEQNAQFTQEVRFASAANAPTQLGEAAPPEVAGRRRPLHPELRAGRGQQLLTVRTLAVPRVPRESAFSPVSARRQRVGAFGQGTVTIRQRLDVTLGARVDYESKEGPLDTFYAPAIAPPMRVNATRTFSNVSPQAALAIDSRMDGVRFGRPWLQGGRFQPGVSSRQRVVRRGAHVERRGGVKTSWAGGRVSANAAVFYIDWNDLQLNLPNLNVPGQFYIANVGARAVPVPRSSSTPGRTHR
jgi:hypothetical protein